MTELTLTAIFEEAEEGGYIGYVAELPGANTQGETLGRNAREPHRSNTVNIEFQSRTVWKELFQ